MSPTIGFLGAGQLGEPMIYRLLGARHEVLVYARRDDVRSRLTERGATVVGSVAELARGSDVVIACLFSDAQLREVGLGTEGLIANAKPGSVFVSHTTGTVATLQELQSASADGPVVLDAPVSGTADDIAAGTLTVLLGGPGDAVAAVTRIVASYADPIVPTGELGTALALKLINNLLFAANAQLLASAAELGTQLGVDPDVLLSTLQVCSAGSHVAAHAHRVGGMRRFEELAGPFLRKDVTACRDDAASSGVDLGLLADVVRRGPMVLDASGD